MRAETEKAEMQGKAQFSRRHEGADLMDDYLKDDGDNRGPAVDAKIIGPKHLHPGGKHVRMKQRHENQQPEEDGHPAGVFSWLPPVVTDAQNVPASLLRRPDEHSPPGLVTARITVLRI